MSGTAFVTNGLATASSLEGTALASVPSCFRPTRSKPNACASVWIALIITSLATGGPVFAQNRVLPEKTTIQLPPGENGQVEGFMLDRPMFLIERAAIDDANATADVNRALAQRLIACAKRTAPPREESPFATAAKWTAIGALVVGAFALGMAVE